MIRQLPPYWFNKIGKTQRLTSTADSGGGVVNTYTDNLTSLPMRFNTKGGSERTGNRVSGYNNYTIYVNGNPAPDIIEKDRIVYASRVFDVIAVNDMDESGVFLALTAEEVFPSGVGA